MSQQVQTTSVYWTSYTDELPEKREKLYRLTPGSRAVFYPCRCGHIHVVNKEKAAVYSGVDCSCGHRSWVDWKAGVLHTGVYKD